uniref:Outer membrane efflux protein n=1 Tax=Candidatus Kentrum sp. DK TaxID=2126562 RepID=A0A450TKG8_9GAMM|nr:MAG: hypothetical protein BECKDK2373B_GA0170837_12067 [Candidatus Kentron sp. DK]
MNGAIPRFRVYLLTILLFTLSGPVLGGEAQSPFSWPWSSQNETPPPAYAPYSLPTFDHNGFDYTDSIPALEQAPHIDGNAVFAAAITCYPAKDKWRIDVDLETRVRSSGISTFDPADGTILGSSYIGIVARMPLYSVSEMDRERTQDYRRRMTTAKYVADFVAGIAERNHALRELGLYSSMEARARIRVGQGITEATEQVKYLDKVAAAQAALVKAESKVMEARLSLVAACAQDKADSFNSWLSRQAQVPTISRRDETRSRTVAPVPVGSEPVAPTPEARDGLIRSAAHPEKGKEEPS